MKIHSPDIYVLIPAGGSGLRFGGEVKKQFLDLQGVSILERTVQAFLDVPEVKRVVLALPRDEILSKSELFRSERVECVEGGGCRATSVRHAFQALKVVSDTDVVLVHDGVRPLVTADLIRRVAAGVAKNGTALPVVKIADTIKKVSEGLVKGTIDRELLCAAQTPQGARYALFRDAYDAVGDALASLTDEAMLWEAAGFTVHTVEGDRCNIKVTTPEDLRLAKWFLQQTN